MRILLAAPDRDLLSCYQKILETEFGEIITAFDGTQVLSLLSEERFDAVILDREIPRVDHRRIVGQLNHGHIPVIVLTDSSVTTHQLTEEPLANAYLTHPFFPEDMISALRDAVNKAASGERLSVAGCEIDISGYRIVGGPRLTAGEMDLLQLLARGESVTADVGAYIGALNEKFAGIGAPARIRYRTEKGFELVVEHE